MSVAKTYYIEHPIGEEWVEYEYEIESDSYEPYVPAKISGPPENCYPAEGGYASLDQGSVRRRKTDPKDAPWERVPFSVFLEALVMNQDIKDDPIDKPYHKTALQKAEQLVEEEMYEACAEDARDAYEAAMEAKADMDREDPIEHRDWDYGGEF
jgi:hypothetical protein